MSDENNPSVTVPGTEQNVPAAESNENVQSATSLRDIVKTLTGREYPSDEEAAKGIQNTYQMVGKRVEPQVVEKTVVPEDVVSKVHTLEQQLKVTSFYAEHPEFKDVKDIIAKFGPDPEQAVVDPSFKKVYDAMQVASASEKSKSVLNTNSRIATPPSDDYTTDLERARQTGDWVGFMAKHKGLQTPE